MGINAIAVQSDGMILVGGDFTALQPNGAATATTRNYIARLKTDGTLDTTFNPNADDAVYTLAVQPDGGILVALSEAEATAGVAVGSAVAGMGVPYDCLVVEKGLGDLRKYRALVAPDLSLIDDGVEAMQFLRRQGQYANAPRPDLILLDLNLPRKDGREVLAAIKSDERFRAIPVVVLTTSRADQDILRAYQLNANCYINKPVDFNQFLEVVRSIETFWLFVVTLPPSPGGGTA